MEEKKSEHLKYPPRVPVIGVPISAVTMESALTFTAEYLDRLRGAYVCASNVHTTVMAYENRDYYAVQQESAMSLPDGKPLSVVGRTKADVPMEKVTGFHYMCGVFQDPRFSGKKHYFYGTRPEDLQDMIRKVRVDYPSLNICGYEPSVFRELSDGEVADLAQRICDAQADFVWVGIGAPRQEYLMRRLKDKVSGIMVGVGGAFNILSGKVNDAPAWMQNAGLEWLYRLCKEPKRLFKRYLVTNTKFLYYCWRDRC